MSVKYLVVVDMQKDFVTGSLGSKEAAEMMPALIDYVKSFDGRVLFTLDTHPDNYMETQEGRNLPVPHCIKGTPGWMLEDGLKEVQAEMQAMLIEKPTFPSVKLAEILKEADDKEGIESITFIGVCTDICVISNALTVKAFLPETPLKVVESLTEATSREMKSKTIDVMRCCQIEII